MLRNRSLRFKLLLSFGFVSGLVVLTTILSLLFMKKINTEYSHIPDVTIPNLQAVAKFNAYYLEANRLSMRVYMGMVQGEPDTLERNGGEIPDRIKDIEALNKEYRSTPFSPGEDVLYEKLWSSWKNYETTVLKYLDLARKGLTDPEAKAEATRVINNDLKLCRDAMGEGIDNLTAFQEKDAQHRADIAAAAFSNSFKLLTTLAIVIVVMALGLGVLFSSYMNKALSVLADKIRNASNETSQASHELTSASSQLSQGATESAASLEETVSSLEELSSMVKLNSDHAKEANSLSKRSLDSAESGEEEIKQLLIAMTDMSKSSKKIEEIINVIDDIAFQTNLLALNAAVEAARAGEQGKGFAVVADAVRNLAGRSAVAAKDINHLIKENVEKTQKGVQIANTSGQTLQTIVESAKKVSDLNAEISAASQEQANGIEQISKAMNHLDQAIQTNASSSEEVASSATEMSSQSDLLISMVQELRAFVDGEGNVATQAETRSNNGGQGGSPRQKPQVKAASKVLPLDESEVKIGSVEGF